MSRMTHYIRCSIIYGTLARQTSQWHFSYETLLEMLDSLESESVFGEDADLNKLKLDNINSIEELEFSELVSINTRRFFNIIGANCDFLNVDPNLWYETESFLRAEEIVKSLTVVNDSCERAISFFRRYKSNINR